MEQIKNGDIIDIGGMSVKSHRVILPWLTACGKLKHCCEGWEKSDEKIVSCGTCKRGKIFDRIYGFQNGFAALVQFINHDIVKNGIDDLSRRGLLGPMYKDLTQEQRERIQDGMVKSYEIEFPFIYSVQILYPMSVRESTMQLRFNSDKDLYEFLGVAVKTLELVDAQSYAYGVYLANKFNVNLDPAS